VIFFGTGSVSFSSTISRMSFTPDQVRIHLEDVQDSPLEVERGDPFCELQENIHMFVRLLLSEEAGRETTYGEIETAWQGALLVVAYFTQNLKLHMRNAEEKARRRKQPLQISVRDFE